MKWNLSTERIPSLYHWRMDWPAAGGVVAKSKDTVREEEKNGMAVHMQQAECAETEASAISFADSLGNFK